MGSEPLDLDLDRLEADLRANRVGRWPLLGGEVHGRTFVLHVDGQGMLALVDRLRSAERARAEHLRSWQAAIAECDRRAVRIRELEAELAAIRCGRCPACGRLDNEACAEGCPERDDAPCRGCGRSVGEMHAEGCAERADTPRTEPLGPYDLAGSSFGSDP